MTPDEALAWLSAQAPDAAWRVWVFEEDRSIGFAWERAGKHHATRFKLGPNGEAPRPDLDWTLARYREWARQQDRKAA